MKKIFVFLLLNFFVAGNLFAQKEDRNWVFGDSIKVNFNDLANPIVTKIGNGIPTYLENYSTISDKNGNLLYYVGEGAQWGANSMFNRGIYGYDETIIPNGDSIFSNASITNGTMFLPSPNDSNKTYLFYLSIVGFSNTLLPMGFYYAILDKSIGSQGVCTSKNNFLVHDTLSEKLAAVKHGNGRDWWIIVHEINGNGFYKFLLTPNGISGPFFQAIGPVSLLPWAGQMKFSPDGSKLAMASCPGHKLLIFDFDRCTGMLSHAKNLGNLDTYGCSFSPNSKIFYASIYEDYTIHTDTLFQFNLDSPNIAQTKIPVWIDGNDSFAVMQHLLGPDGKIYLANAFVGYPNYLHDTATMNLTVISNPDVYGLGCNVEPYSFHLNGSICYAGLPNIPNYNLGILIGSPCDTLHCLNSSYSSSQKICAGDTLFIGNHAHFSSGIFTDTLHVFGGCDSVITTLLTIDTVSVTVNSIADSLTANASGVGIAYQWFNCDSSENIVGATNQNYVATANGNYAVIATDANNCSKQSDCIYVDVLGIIDEPSIDNQIKIYPNPASNELTIISSHQSINTIAVFDLMGKQVTSFGFGVSGSLNLKSKIINLKSFSPGVYFIKLQLHDGSWEVRRFVRE